MGLFSSAMKTIAGPVGELTGAFIDRSETRHLAKSQYKYNRNLQNQNIDFQKYMAENAHQIEMQDLKDANLNPALTAMQSNAGAIAGSSAAQGTSAGATSNAFGNAAKDIIDGINNLRATNANIDVANAEVTKLKAEAEALNRGGWNQMMLGTPLGELVNLLMEKFRTPETFSQKMNKKVKEDYKNYNKEEKEIADKIDNFYKSFNE